MQELKAEGLLEFGAESDGEARGDEFGDLDGGGDFEAGFEVDRGLRC